MNRTRRSSVPGVRMGRVRLALSLIAALIVSALVAQAAIAASEAVFVRVEGGGTTLLPQTLVDTSSAPTVRGHLCPGSSAAGALTIATDGDWAGKFEQGSGYADFFVNGILGERPTGNDFWTLWVNGRTASTGACETPLHPGDHELWFDCVADSSYNCTDNPLRLEVPALVKLRGALKASVVQLDGAGHSAPVADAVVHGDGVLAVSHTGGRASLIAHKPGEISLQASKSGATPSDPVLVCVYRTRPSECAASSAGPPVDVRGIREGEVFATGPRELRGTAGPDAAGLIDVGLSLRRRAPDHSCSYLDVERGSWHATGCNASVPSFSIGPNSSWSYLLPAALRPGGYQLRVTATDGNGRKTKLRTGRSSVDFKVR